MRLNPPSTEAASVIMFISASLWGLYWMPLRYLEDLGMDGSWSVALLNVPAAIALLGLAAWQWGRHRPFVQKAILIGFFTGAGLALYGVSLVHSSVVRATLLFYLTPVWSTLIGVIWLCERATWQRWAAIAAGLTGLLLMMSGGGSVPLNIGDAFAILSGMFWAVGASLIVRHSDVPVPGMVAVQFVFTALIAILLGVATATASWMPPPMPLLIEAGPTLLGISIILFLPAVCVIFWVQKFLFPGRAGLLMMSEALMAVVSASLLLPEEQMSLVAWIGAAMIVSACLIEVLLAPQQAPKTNPA